MCWFGQGGETDDRWTKGHRGSSAFKKNDIPQSCTDAQSEEAQLFSRGGKGPKLNNASITGQQTCSYDMYGKNDLALQLFFFFPPSRQLLRFDFNAFCVVLYFHAEILLYLNVFILLNVLNFFWLLYPRIAVIIHVAVSKFFL